MLAKAKIVILIMTLSCICHSVAGQIDSTFVKGELELKNGYYEAKKWYFKGVLIPNPNDSSSLFFLKPKLLISTEEIEETKYDYYEGGEGHVLVIRFKQSAYKKWADLTANLVGDYLVLIVDNKMIQVREVMGSIPNGFSFVGGAFWTKEKLLELKESLTN